MSKAEPLAEPQATPQAQTAWRQTLSGSHWLLDLADCRCGAALLGDAPGLEALTVKACKDLGLSVVASRFHCFDPPGVTGVVLLAESHLSLHTWPAQAYVSADVYVCNHGQDNAGKAQALALWLEQVFASGHPHRRMVARGPIPKIAP